MNIRLSMDRRSSTRIVDLERNELASDEAIVLYEEDAAGNIVVDEDRGDSSPAHHPPVMDARDALRALHDIAVWRR